MVELLWPAFPEDRIFEEIDIGLFARRLVPFEIVPVAIRMWVAGSVLVVDTEAFDEVLAVSTSTVKLLVLFLPFLLDLVMSVASHLTVSFHAR